MELGYSGSFDSCQKQFIGHRGSSSGLDSFREQSLYRSVISGIDVLVQTPESCPGVVML